MKQTRPMCLASASPRRRELLERFGLRFEVRAVDVDESPLPGEAPEAHVARLAEAKAGAAARSWGPGLVLAGDTVVVLAETVLGKPVDPLEAADMLARLSGRTHRVLTAYALLEVPDGEAIHRTVETAVTFRPLPALWIDWYAGTPEALDKAGAYAIQGIGGAMVSRIEGSFNNVVGLPVEHIVWEMLEREWLTL